MEMINVGLPELMCIKQLPNGKLEIGKVYRAEFASIGHTDFSTYFHYKIGGYLFSNVKYDPYFIYNYFGTKAQFRDMRIDEILND